VRQQWEENEQVDMQTIPGIPPTQTIRVRSGRTVGYYEYGDPAGAPLFALHGVPSCGAGFAWADDPARERGLRVIAPDRPGVGLSDPVPRRPVAEYASELVALADAFGFDRFAVLGYSGGGPFALALAHGAAERLTTVGVASGMGQVGVWADRRDFETTDARFLDMAVERPWLARTILRTVSAMAKLSPKQAVASFAKELSPSDREVLREIGEPRAAMALFTHAFLRGARGVVDDYATLSGPWGFDVEAITVPVPVWQGDADTMVPIAHAHALVERVPGATLTVYPGEGHLAPVTHIGEILDAFATAPS
jgi:pimeloyl-ACP methyl ester carboxylesterase